MAKNHVTANLLMLFFVIGGLVMSRTIKQEVFPEINLDQVQVSVVYPGASPEEVEEGIILPIEDAVSGLDGVKEIKARAVEGMAVVTAVLETDANPDMVLINIKNEVDRITILPEDAEQPVVAKALNRREVLSLVVYGNVSEKALRERADTIRDKLLELPGITQTELSGVRPYEISIEIPEDNLRRYGITLNQVASRIKQASIDLAGGSVKAVGGEILVRTKQKRYRGPGYEDIIVLVQNDGTALKLGDIGTVKDGFAETDEFAIFDGMPAVMIGVYRVGNQKPTQIAKIVNKYVREESPKLPSALHLAVWNDTSELYSSRLHLLLKNAAFGLLLVFLVLTLFLQTRLALWVMLGIPVSFLGALLVMPAMDVSVNMISLFAFIMALGIVVDDAIVIGENIYEHRQKGKDYLQASIDGVKEVGGPVIFSVLTSVAAFIPLLFVEGTLGKFIKVIPMVVISILLVSLVESLFVLPAHLAIGKARKDADKNSRSPVKRFRTWFDLRLNAWINGPYRHSLGKCIEFRYASLAAAIVILILSVGLIKGGFLKFTFMPVVDGDKVTASLVMPRGALIGDTAAVEKMLAEKAREVISEVDREQGGDGSILRHIFAVVGGTVAKGGPKGQASTAAAYLCDVAILLQPSDFRKIPAEEITRRWRQKVGEVAGIESLGFSSNLMHMGENINVQLSHDNFSVLSPAAAKVKRFLRRYPGLSGIADNYPAGKKELKIKLKPEARMLGITEEDLGRQLRAAFYGAEALRMQRGRNEVKVMVRYPYESRRNLWDLRNMRIHTPDGGEMSLAQAADISEGVGYSEINRTDRKRVINITANIDNKKANAAEILADLKSTLLTQLVNDYPGLTYDLEGEARERRDSMSSMLGGFILALFAIYALLAIPFRSYSQPLLVMSAIPFGIVGAILGHWIMGFSLSMLSIFGIVALSGVVVNDSLLLVDQINRQRAGGKSMFAAVTDSGCRRFRPIILTSVTTFFGLVPMLMETSVQAQFLIPMAISLAFGIMFSTFITLILVPVFYTILADFSSDTTTSASSDPPPAERSRSVP
jgi:multidrug efflux pump subunit AcrB